MKYILIFIMVISFAQLSAQDNTSLIAQSSSSFYSNNTKRFGAFMFFSNPNRGVDGSVYMFKDWNNSMVIHTADDKRLLIRKINLNLERNTFEAKISQDSIFSFNFNNIKEFIINNRIYKNFYYNDDNRVYEMIYESEELSLLKGFKIKFIEASPNPMNMRSRDKFFQVQSYFIKTGDKIKPILLKKNKILNLIKDKKIADKVKNYAKMNELSFSSENGIRKILEYYNNLISSGLAQNSLQD